MINIIYITCYYESCYGTHWTHDSKKIFEKKMKAMVSTLEEG